MMELTVAAVQPHSVNGDPQANLARAALLVGDAVRRGAELVLCPEFLATGYSFEESIWDAAEPADGLTAMWLRDTAAEHGVYLGASFLEAVGEDFVNTFVFMGPSGVELGRIRKDRPPLAETFVFKAVTGQHVIDCDLGKVGVGICAENQRGFVLDEFECNRPELVLMPHSAPGPRIFTGGLHLVPQQFACRLGVPVVLANKSGTLHTRLPPLPGPRVRLTFPGASAICDQAGNMRARLGPEPGVIVERVVIGSTRPPRPSARERLSWFARVRLLEVCAFPAVSLIETLGRRAYTHSDGRRAAARAVSSGA